MVLFDDDDETPLHQVLVIILLLLYHNSLRNRHYLHRSAILEPQHSPWKKLYENGDSKSFLHMTGLTRRAFGSLLDYLFDLKKLFLAAGADGLVHWTRMDISGSFCFILVARCSTDIFALFLASPHPFAVM
jgi:hypothetical protein